MSVEELALGLPRAEKLRLMEALWGDLAGEPDTIQSPAWQEKALRAAEDRFGRGEVKVVDWNDTKRILETDR